MSYIEYLDLYLKAQQEQSALYYVVSFDVINSKLLSSDERLTLQHNINIIVKYVYDKLLEKELEEAIQIVIKDPKFIRPWDIKNKTWNGNYIDPMVFGDCFQFTVLKGTVTKEEIIEWVDECKEVLNVKERFHIADGYYETNDYGDGNALFFRGYCLKTLETLHKPIVQKELAKLKKKYKLINSSGETYLSETPGTLGGHRKHKIYGRLDCPSAKRWIAKGKYISNRVFFESEEVAIQAGYRPCAVCMPNEYKKWKEKQGGKQLVKK